jgi:uncharacterized repeat protein (TIGR03803 family)
MGELKTSLGDRRTRSNIATGASLFPALLAQLIIAATLLFPGYPAFGQVVFSNLYSFPGPPGGSGPSAGLAQGGDGYFYGTTLSGGPYSNQYGSYGTVFRIAPDGTLTNLHLFAGGSDGIFPGGGLTPGSDGYFYGTTQTGGTSNFGTIFRISVNGVLTNLYSIRGGNDGQSPFGGLVLGSDGYFYGTTFSGGTNGNGTIFRVSANGAFTSLYSFIGGVDGATAIASLVQGSDGYLYGTTYTGGQPGPVVFRTSYGNGTVFKIGHDGTFTHLYSFTNGIDGAMPYAGLVQGNDGYFYGTTLRGGVYGGGTIFKISNSGFLTSLYSFTEGSDGSAPSRLLNF